MFDLVVRVVPPPAAGAASAKLKVQHLMRVDRYEVYRSCQPPSNVKEEVAATVGAGKIILFCVCDSNRSDNDVDAGGDTTVTWTLLPEGCALTDEKNTAFQVTARDKLSFLKTGGVTQGSTSKPGSNRQDIRVPCADGSESKVEIEYDFSALAEALGDSNATGLEYKTPQTHVVPAAGCSGENVGWEPIKETEQDCQDQGLVWDEENNACKPARGEDSQEVANPCTSAKIFPPNNDNSTGKENVRIKWELQPDDCELSSSQNATIQVTAYNQYAKPTTRYSGEKTVSAEYAGIHIPNNCNWDETTTKKITYDFSAIGIALGDPQAETRAYIQDVTHPVGRGTCENVEKPPVVALDRISHHKDASCEADPYSGAVSCTGATSPPHDQLFYYVWTKITNYPVIDDYPDPPTWSATGVRFMKIYLKKSGEQDRTIKYFGGGSSEWDALLAENAGWQLKKVSPSISGWESPEKGNFFLQIGASDTTISKYHIPTP